MATEESKQFCLFGGDRTGDPVHAGDEALTRETPVQRGRVNRYAPVLVTTNLAREVSTPSISCGTHYTMVLLVV